MLRKTVSTIVLGTAMLGSLFAAGCTSAGGEKPYALTGEKTTLRDDQGKERLRWTDDKGHYRTDLRQAGGPPLRYVP